MSWSINSIIMYVQDRGGQRDQIMAKLQPLNYKSVYQTFGYETVVTTLTGIVVGSTDMNAILDLVTTGLSYALSTPYGSYGNFFVKSVKYKQTPSICQTMRPDLAEDSPVYSVDLELWKDE